MDDGPAVADVAQRFVQIEKLLREVLDRQERNAVKARLELSAHREISEGAGYFLSERIEEKELQNRLFERDREGWQMIGLTPISDTNITGESLFLIVFRQSCYYESKGTET